MTPFVEMFINGVDILRSSDGRPKRLVSFQHTDVMNGNGDWQIEVFDPDYTGVEELLLAMVAKKDPAAKVEGEENEVASPALFRYGYISQDGKVISAPQSGEEFFVGQITHFVPSYQPHGTFFTVVGKTIWSGDWDWAVEKRAFYETNIYDIIKRVCDIQGWVFKPLGEPEDAEELPEGKRPAVLLEPQQGVDDTEERPRSFRVQDKEGPYEFVKRLCSEARTTDPKYQGFSCKLEYRADGSRTDTGVSPTKVTGYLYFGPSDVLASPVRKYVYMRDPKSDILSFSPSISVAVAVRTGAAGAYVKTDDPLRGETSFHAYTELDRHMKYFTNRRLKSGMTLAELGNIQEGEPEEELPEPKYEGAATGPTQLAPQRKPEPDAAQVEISSHVTNRFLTDHQYMNVWLHAQNFVNEATLEIVGDPYLTPPNLIAVYMFIPVEDNEFRVHWTSSIWKITGVSHNISSGTYITLLELVRNGYNVEGGITTLALYNTLADTMDKDALEKLGA
jgi:hypothetical protein